MHFRAVFAAVFSTTSLFILPAQAADITTAGAEELRSSLTRYLPEKLVESGVVSVQPASRRYEIVVDLSKLAEAGTTSDFSITGLKPMSMFAEPAENDQWKIESGGYLDLVANYKIADIVSKVTYKIGSYSYNGLFDPAISNFRTSDFKAKDLTVTSSSGTEQVDASFGEMSGTSTATDGSNGTVDFVSQGSLSAFSENIVTPQSPPVKISADSIGFDVAMKGVMVRELREVVYFVLDHAKEETLTPDQATTLKGLVRKALPFAQSIDETVTLNNLLVGTPMGDVGVRNVVYGLKSTGLTNATSFEVSIDAKDPTVPATLLPEMYASLVPQSVEFAFGMPDMDVAGVINEFLDKMDVSKTEVLTPEESEALGKKIFKNGILTMDIRRLAAKSEIYDVEMTGTMKGFVDQPKKFAFDATIFARDYDKTIAFLQEAAKQEPQLNQVSFGLMMIKGFAKSEADGRQRWDISVAEDGAVKVNGQTVKAAD